MAEYLARQGWAVDVLAGMPHYPQWRTFDSYRERLRMTEAIAGVRVHRFGHYVPRRQSALQRALYEATFFANVLLGPWGRPPDAVIGVIPGLSGGLLARI